MALGPAIGPPFDPALGPAFDPAFYPTLGGHPPHRDAPHSPLYSPYLGLNPQHRDAYSDGRYILPRGRSRDDTGIANRLPHASFAAPLRRRAQSAPRAARTPDHKPDIGVDTLYPVERSRDLFFQRLHKSGSAFDPQQQAARQRLREEVTLAQRPKRGVPPAAVSVAEQRRLVHRLFVEDPRRKREELEQRQRGAEEAARRARREGAQRRMGPRSTELAESQQRRALSEVFDVLLATVLYTKHAAAAGLLEPPGGGGDAAGADSVDFRALHSAPAVDTVLPAPGAGALLPTELQRALAEQQAAQGRDDAPLPLFSGSPTARASVALISVGPALTAAGLGPVVGAAAVAAGVGAMQDGGLLSRAHGARPLSSTGPAVAVAAAVAAAAMPSALSPLQPSSSSSSSSTARAQSPVPGNPLMEASSATRWTLKVTVGNHGDADADADADHATATTLTSATSDPARPPRAVQVRSIPLPRPPTPRSHLSPSPIRLPLAVGAVQVTIGPPGRRIRRPPLGTPTPLPCHFLAGKQLARLDSASTTACSTDIRAPHLRAVPRNAHLR